MNRRMRALHLCCIITCCRGLTPQPAPTTPTKQHSVQSTGRRGALRILAAAPLATAFKAKAAPPEQPTVSREVLSGLAGGAAQRITKDVVLYPIDTVKVRLQTVQGRQLSRRVFVDPYAGVLAPLVVGVPAAALFFGVKDGLGELAAEQGLTDPFLVEAVTVCLANAPYWLARAPIELIKTRQQLANNTMEKPWAVAQSIVDNEGLAGLWTGFQESYWHAVPADVLKFSVYRTLKERYGSNSIVRKALLGSCASAVALSATTPLDVAKTRSMERGAASEDIIRRLGAILDTEGVGALYAGLGPRVARAAVSGGLQFGSYEAAKRLFG